MLSPLCAVPLNVGEIPPFGVFSKVRKPVNMKDKSFSIAFSLLVCFHAFLICFPFVVC